MTFLDGGGGIFFEAPSEINFFPEDQEFIGDDVEVFGIWDVDIDGIGGAIEAHGAILGSQFNLVEHGQSLALRKEKGDEDQSNQLPHFGIQNKMMIELCANISEYISSHITSHLCINHYRWSTVQSAQDCFYILHIIIEYFRLFNSFFPIKINLSLPMGAQNEKEARPAEPSLVADPDQEVYQISTEKLFTSLQTKGLKPQGAVSMRDRKNSMPRLGAVREDELVGSQAQFKEARSITKMSVPFESPAKVAYPQCCVGYIEAEEEGRVAITGSAFLIHKKLALTCAHNCLKPDSRKEYSSLYLCLRYDGQTLRVKIKKPHYLDAFFEGDNLIKSENYLDFAVLELEKNMDENLGYLGLSFQSNEINPSSVITALGFVSRGDGPELMRREMKISSMGPKIFGFPGQLDQKMYGGPLLFLKDNEYYVFGISLAPDPSASEPSTKAFKLYRYLFQTLNSNFSKTIGHLNLKYRWVRDGKMEKVIKEKYQLVTDLILEGNVLGVEGVTHLVKAGWSELRFINLTNNNLGDDGLDVLCSGSWPKLAKLMLGNNLITTAGMDSFRKCTWTDLTSLRLQENKLKNKGVEAIVNASFKNLTELNLYQTLINWQGVKMIVEAGYNNLEILELGANRIREEGAKWLAKGQWIDLQSLGLSQATITDAAVEHFKDANWPNLKVLDLSKNHLTQVGLDHLLRCNFKKIRDLTLRDNKIAGKGISAMATAGWVQLQEVDIRWNSFSEGDKQNLKDFGKSFPKMRKLYI